MNKPRWYEVVTRPFAFKDVEIMPQTVSQNSDRALAICYLDARAVMNRLDEAFGPENWAAFYTPTTIGNHHGVLCRLVCDADGRQVVREDGSAPSDVEPFKGAISDSLKRAFAALGHRLLYKVDLGWQGCVKRENGKFSHWTDQSYANMKAIYERTLGIPSTFPVAPDPLPEHEPEKLKSIADQARLDHDRKATALTFLRKIGVLNREDNDRPFADAKDDFAAIKAVCKEKKLVFDQVVCEAMAEGADSAKSLLEYVNGR